MIDKSTIELLVRMQSLEEVSLAPNDGEFDRLGDDMYILNGTSTDTSDEEQYIIYDCCSPLAKFDFPRFEKLLAEWPLASPVMLFENWDKERDKYWEYHDTLKTGAEKKTYAAFFQKKISIYKDVVNSVTLNVGDDGINYLEYRNATRPSSDKSISSPLGFAYNISFFELKKLFNVAGNDLFRRNVRFGIDNHPVGQELKRKFKEYISIFINEQVVEKKSYAKLGESEIQAVADCLDINEENQEFRHPRNFWFYHNGITIFSYDSNEILRPETSIHLIPSKVSVINGAQTMTHFFWEVESMIRTLKKALPKCADTVTEMLNDFLKATLVKTIIISGDETFVHPITYGLNTQIPIKPEDIISNTKHVEDINKVIKLGNMKILKPGEPPVVQYGFTPLEFVKYFLIINGKPGEAKNYQKARIEEDIRGIHSSLISKRKPTSAATKYIADLRTAIIVNQWWSNRNKNIDSENQEKSVLDKYGKNYFQSYVTEKLDGEVDESDLEQFFAEFVKDMDSAKKADVLKLEDFKNDVLFSRYKETLSNKSVAEDSGEATSTAVSNTISSEVAGKIAERLNKEFDKKYTQAKVIAECLAENKVKIEKYRTINLVDEKCKEHFPLQSSTFSELCLLPLKDKRPNFDSSKFKTQIEKNFPVFLIHRKKGDNPKEDSVESVQFLPDFSFSKYIEQAEEVYNLTLEAFEEGDETKFPKAGDKKQFHIRPKAINADDSFEFTNGEYITKRTFWANKETVESIIAEVLKSDELSDGATN